MTDDELLRLAASVEKGSEHPLGEAIWAEATTRGLSLAEPAGFKAEAGHGVQAEVEGRSVMVGNMRMIDGAGSPWDVSSRKWRVSSLKRRRPCWLQWMVRLQA